MNVKAHRSLSHTPQLNQMYRNKLFGIYMKRLSKDSASADKSPNKTYSRHSLSEEVKEVIDEQSEENHDKAEL